MGEGVHGEEINARAAAFALRTDFVSSAAGGDESEIGEAERLPVD